MNEKPILFNGEMVRAILDGRKTQTRRIVKLPHSNPLGAWEPEVLGGPGCYIDRAMTVPAPAVNCLGHTRTGDTVFCPYGEIGGRLWVRETWKPDTMGTYSTIHFKADGSNQAIENTITAAELWDSCRRPEEQYPKMQEPKWRPSIHMPRWASRIALEIIDIRVERLNDISDKGASNDCTAEGVFHTDRSLPTDWQERGFSSCEKCAFHDLWQSINGPDSWDENPWVWVVEFKRLEL